MSNIWQSIKECFEENFDFFIGMELGIMIGLALMFFSTNRYDVNRDGKVTSTDYVLIKNYIMED